MNIKDYVIAVVLSAAAGLLLMFGIWLLSHVSWILMWAVFAFTLVPFGMKAIQFYRDTECRNVDDFLVEVNNCFKGKQKKKKSSIDNCINDIDW